jgi:hypothetical protein
VKIWSFIFPDPSWPLLSARVAAPDKAGAALLLGAALDLGLAGTRPGAPVADGVICQYLGQEERAAGVISAIAREAA